MIWRAGVLSLVVAVCACGPSEKSGVTGTVELGDNFVAPDLQLDEDFFYCRIQPQVISKYGCASGQSGEQGSCHDSRSALRLIATKAPAPCDQGGMVVGTVPDEYMANFEAIRFFVQSDPLTSPLYLRPTNMASHPRRIFDETDPAAKLIVDWIAAGAQ